MMMGTFKCLTASMFVTTTRFMIYNQVEKEEKDASKEEQKTNDSN